MLANLDWGCLRVGFGGCGGASLIQAGARLANEGSEGSGGCINPCFRSLVHQNSFARDLNALPVLKHLILLKNLQR